MPELQKKSKKEGGDNAPTIIDFIGIGASRSGTSFISKCLNQHPDICLPSIKEVHFFDNERAYKKGLPEYKKYFTKCANNSIRGEFTPLYLSHSDAPQRIYTHFPNVKLIACLRNPIEATYSQYFYNRGYEKESARTFEEALHERGEIVYYPKRKYYTHLEKYLELFPREQVLIMIYEDIQKDPVAFMQKIFCFLEVDDSFVPPSATEYVNASPLKSTYTRIPFLNRIIARGSRMSGIIGWASTSYLVQKIYDWNKPPIHKRGTEKIKKPAMKKETRHKLREYFADEITGIADILNRDLSFWK
jgi:hypothetical protein